MNPQKSLNQAVCLFLLFMLSFVVYEFTMLSRAKTNCVFTRTDDEGQVMKTSRNNQNGVGGVSVGTANKSGDTEWKEQSRDMSGESQSTEAPPQSTTRVQSSEETPIRRWPQALIIGFSKCGTSALGQFLSLHPDIVWLPWEAAYFCDMHYKNMYRVEWYRQIMPVSTSRQITLEKSPCYIQEEESMERIKEFNETIKLIVIVKDPIQRLLSERAQVLSRMSDDERKEAEPIDRWIMPDNYSIDPYFVEGLEYTTRLGRVYKLFPRNQIHIVDGDRFISNPLSELEKVETFLGLRHCLSEEDIYFSKEKGFYCYRYRETGVEECFTSSKGRPHDTISPRVLDKVKEAFRPYSEDFFKMVGRRFDWDI